MKQKFFRQVNLEDRNEMINFLNGHSTAIPFSDYPEMWTYANNIGFLYNLPEHHHVTGLDAITEQDKTTINNLITRFKHKHNFKFGAYRSDYNDNVLLLMHRIEIGKERSVKIQNFDKFPYDSCSMQFLQERTKLLCSFDALCDKIVLEYYQMIAKYVKSNVGEM
jgi:hypothetical protein